MVAGAIWAGGSGLCKKAGWESSEEWASEQHSSNASASVPDSNGFLL